MHRRIRNTLIARSTVAGLALSLAACGSSTTTTPAAPVTTTRSTLVPASYTGTIDARTSQIVTDGSPPSQVFDDVTLSSAATIGSVAWQGIYCVQQSGSSAPAPTASAFTLTFYPDSSGYPKMSAPIKASTYTVAQVGQTFNKNVSGLTCGSAVNTTWALYDYSVTLSSPVSLAAGTKYWFSVEATTPSYAVYFGWRNGTVDNNLSLGLFQGAFSTFTFDRAFSLTSLQ